MAKQVISKSDAIREHANAFRVFFGRFTISVDAPENDSTVRSSHGPIDSRLNFTRMRFTKRSTGRSTRTTKSGRTPPRTMTVTKPPTSTMASMPSASQPGSKPTVRLSTVKVRIMMHVKPESMHSCMSSAALVALPADMPCLCAVSTTSEVPAKLSEGAMVFTKNVPNTKESPVLKVIFSPTVSKQARKPNPWAKYLPSWASTAKMMNNGEPV